ncbi:uncharacterized protein A4U43_C08F28110 [Asparagus officinalis]|nr:uncharacterized protein A4U43_C08F28110 [Asparagus officinalis]
MRGSRRSTPSSLSRKLMLGSLFWSPESIRIRSWSSSSFLMVKPCYELFFKLRAKMEVVKEAGEVAELVATTKGSELDELKRARP